MCSAIRLKVSPSTRRGARFGTSRHPTDVAPAVNFQQHVFGPAIGQKGLCGEKLMACHDDLL